MTMLGKFEAPWGEAFQNVAVEVGRYGNGSLAIRLTLPDEEDDVLAIPTVNLVEAYGLVPRKGCVFIPSYSENEGMAQALVDVGVVELTGRLVAYGPFDASAQEAKVLPPYLWDEETEPQDD